MGMRLFFDSAALIAAGLAAWLASPPAQAVEMNARQADVARWGALVMPFDLAKTRHVFTKTPSGGVQRVVARDAGDSEQVRLVREHLKDIAGRFYRGDFSGPASIHGEDMPGLAELRAAKPDQWTLAYRDLEGGAEIEYASAQPGLVHAIHAWFDAQLADHGQHAMPGHHPGMVHSQ